MTKKEQDKIEYALKKASLLLSPERSSFDFLIKRILLIENDAEKKSLSIKSPYSSSVWFFNKRFIFLKMAPVTLVIALAVIIGAPEISNTRSGGLADEIIKDIENDQISFSSLNE